ncbi:methyl-accepting chemotaxis protein [Halalkalibacter wakoensis JCM 9140]|uniref:Methyl-accepting chemotaxis protein n=1 Tax=Halalkalibacter wakoensis JCM 9140 TaxID=1236970 RepID=W4Q6V0_9BACI|nr:methyl-accepting chemotaxis protein [Halalkalibacter wakoensis]GAE27791.1 methyl-accepting chemotaxis protein [Halalkalibacter wakoensis JCM 9140]
MTKITKKLGIIIISMMLICIAAISFSNYKITYDKVLEAAGIELYGCANITTGLLDTLIIEQLASGDFSQAVQTGELISWTVDHKDIFSSQYILSLDGTLLAVDETMQEQGFSYNEPFFIDEEVLFHLTEMKHPTYSDVYEYGGMKRLTGYAPIFKDHDPTKEVIAISAIDFDAQIISERTWSMIGGGILVGMIPVLLVGVITVWLIGRTIRPLIRLNQYAQQIADGDLTVPPLTIKNEDRKDEIDELTTNFNGLVANFKTILKEVGHNSDRVFESSKIISQGSEQVSDSVEKISLHLQDVANGNKMQADRTVNIDTSISTITNDFSNIGEKIKRVSELSSVTTSQASEGNIIVEKAIGQMHSIDEQTNVTVEVISNLNNKANEIQEILTLITGFAEQTNLLALNASIEAARAGSHGAGFSVVAQEVRKLAEESGKATTQIATLINQIKSESSSAVSVAEKGSKSVKEGLSLVRDASHSFKEIAASIYEITNDTSEVDQLSTMINQNIREIAGTIEEIKNISIQNSDNVQQVAESTEIQSATMQEIVSSINTLVHTAETLLSEVSQFKTN